MANNSNMQGNGIPNNPMVQYDFFYTCRQS